MIKNVFNLNKIVFLKQGVFPLFNNFNKLQSAFLYNIPSIRPFTEKTTTEDKAKSIEEYFNNMSEELDNALSANEADQEKRVRLLSLKLINYNSSKDIISLFEEKYIKGLVNTIYGEELSLFVYFYVSLLDKEVRSVASDSTNKVFVDKRLDKIFKMLNEKLNELDVINLLALSWSISLLISKFGYPISDSLKKSIIKQLPPKLEVDKKGEIPTICFSISSYLSEDQELNKIIEDRIVNYSNLFFSEDGLDYYSALNTSLLCISWTRVKIYDVDLLEKATDSLIEIKESLTEENIEEVCKIMWSFYMLNYKNERITEFLKFYLEHNMEKININNAIDLFVSLSSLFSDNSDIIYLLIETISHKSKDMDLILDINSFVNLWLGISKFYLKGGETSIEGVSHMISFLISNYEKRNYLSTNNMTLDEICSLLVSFSVLDLEPNTIYNDLGFSIKNNIEKFNNIQLIQLMSCGKYLFNTKKHSDLYYLIHDACVTSKSSFDNNQLKTLKRILTTDAIITNSIFVSNKI